MALIVLIVAPELALRVLVPALALFFALSSAIVLLDAVAITIATEEKTTP